MSRENEWHPELITEFWVGCETTEFTHRVDREEWKETGLTGKVRDTIVDVNIPCLSITTGCPYSGRNKTKVLNGL